MEPACIFWMAQVATPEAFTACVQLATVVPFSANVMVPLGAVGVNATPVSAAVNVTFVFTAEGLAGAGVTVIVAASADTVCGRAEDVEVSKLESPE